MVLRGSTTARGGPPPLTFAAVSPRSAPPPPTRWQQRVQLRITAAFAWLGHKVMTSRLKELTLLTLPYQVAAVITALIAVGYAKLFDWMEVQHLWVLHNHPNWVIDHGAHGLPHELVPGEEVLALRRRQRHTAVDGRHRGGRRQERERPQLEVPERTHHRREDPEQPGDGAGRRCRGARRSHVADRGQRVPCGAQAPSTVLARREPPRDDDHRRCRRAERCVQHTLGRYRVRRGRAHEDTPGQLPHRRVHQRDHRRHDRPTAHGQLPRSLPRLSEDGDRGRLIHVQGAGDRAGAPERRVRCSAKWCSFWTNGAAA